VIRRDGFPTVPGALRRSSGVAMVAQPVSVAPYTLMRTSPNAFMNASDRCGGSAEPPDTTTRRLGVSGLSSTSRMRWSITGTATSASAPQL
jgi:hypothetical protein